MPAHRRVQIGIVAALLAIIALVQRPDGRLHLFFIEGAGDAVLIQAPNGSHILVDGGSDPAALVSGIGAHLPFWKRHLDAVVLTSADRAHLPGQVAALARYQAGLVVVTGLGQSSAVLSEWQRQLRVAGAALKVGEAGQTFRVGGLAFQILVAGTAGSGMVLRIEYGRTSAVLAHTISPAMEQAIIDTGGV
ncbi:MAG: hypothetical protein H7Z42_08430, partial [Roseiflexaceae bacterium]|nr:hypothetical protein [Roseiflexaceae bacterium]